jgi:glycosyltransferase involved in cell wall biosynthesis
MLGYGISPDFTERLKATLRGVLSRKRSVIVSAARHSLGAAQRRMWEQSSGIQLLSRAEAQALETRGFALGQKKCAVIRNGVFPPDEGRGLGLRSDVDAFIARHKKFCVIGGRIEPRKNQCALLEIAALAHIPMVFAGAMNHRHGSYARRFVELVKMRENVLYAGAVSRPYFQALLLECHQHISVSLFEVSSLVDLEARAAGAWIISSKSGYAQEFLDGGAYMCDPWSYESIEQSVGAAWAKQGRAARMNVPSWDDAGDRLADLYKQVLALS